MLRGGLEPWHIFLILAVFVVLFGSRKLPDAARSMGQSLRIFKSEMKAAAKDDTPAGAVPQPGPIPAPQAVQGTVINQTVTDSVPQAAPPAQG